MVLDDDYIPVEPIQKYLHYLDSCERSPNTIQTYAYNLKLFWEFLQDNSLDWREVNLEKWRCYWSVEKRLNGNSKFITINE